MNVYIYVYITSSDTPSSFLLLSLLFNVSLLLNLYINLFNEMRNGEVDLDFLNF